MSLAIDTDNVARVLLIDGWHGVVDNSFTLDAYEYIEGERLTFGGGQSPLIPSAGAMWYGTDGRTYYCPLTSVLAVSTSIT